MGRKARLRYRDPVDRTPRKWWQGDRYAPWVRELRGKSGAYVIRDASTRETLYVGESHTGRLRGTLTRHFRRWTGFHAGETYDRDRVEVAVRITDKGDAYAEQVALIERLRPRDNDHHNPDVSAAAAEEIDSADFQDDV